MMKLNFLGYGLFSLFFLYSCQSTNKSEDAKKELTPVEGNDETRYNINEPDKELLQLDSASADSISKDTLNE